MTTTTDQSGISADIAHKLEQRIDTLDTKLDTKLEDLTKAVLKLEGALMPRAEIYAEDAKRVSAESYTVAHQALLDRVTRLESGPQRVLGYVGAATGCLSATFVFLGLLASIVLALINNPR